MNFNKFINSDYLKENPLCGIDTYKDELNLATGACTRQIRKLMLTGNEAFDNQYGQSLFGVQGLLNSVPFIAGINAYSTHFKYNPVQSGLDNAMSDGEFALQKTSGGGTPYFNLFFKNTAFTSTNAFKSYLAQQYATGTPVTVWYVLATPTTETITVPSGLSGTEEGYLNQSGTPTPSNPIYPTANTVEQWFDLNHYIMGTSTDTITTLPTNIYVNDTTATVGLKGNMVQSGTPTSTNPIQPQETGEMTRNLLNPSDILFNTIFDQQESPPAFVNSNTYNCSNFISVTSGMYLRILNNVAIGNYFFEFDANKQFLRAKAPGQGVPMSISNDASYVVFNFEKTYDINKYMFARTSTPIPYEPYGYKIPISSVDTTTNVYLGEVETTRRIKKLVFDGTEGWIQSSAGNGAYYYYLTNVIPYTKAICSHVPYSDTGTGTGEMVNFDANSCQLRIDSNYTVDEFKAYLATQYANGTPVTVWYVLATEETATVNEPIRKIGNYTDTVSNITIPTIAGTNTISVNTTLQPSEVSVNYKGWHPIQSVHEYDSNYTIATMQTLTIAQLQTHTISELQGGWT